jgi:hypothetical protein
MTWQRLRRHSTQLGPLAAGRIERHGKARGGEGVRLRGGWRCGLTRMHTSMHAHMRTLSRLLPSRSTSLNSTSRVGRPGCSPRSTEPSGSTSDLAVRGSGVEELATKGCTRLRVATSRFTTHGPGIVGWLVTGLVGWWLRGSPQHPEVVLSGLVRHVHRPARHRPARGAPFTRSCQHAHTRTVSTHTCARARGLGHPRLGPCPSFTATFRLPGLLPSPPTPRARAHRATACSLAAACREWNMSQSGCSSAPMKSEL